MWHKIASAALGIGAFCAAKFIPAGLVLTLGPVGIPVAGLVAGATALAAAVGIEPTKVSDTVAGLVNSVTIGALGQQSKVQAALSKGNPNFGK